MHNNVCYEMKINLLIYVFITTNQLIILYVQEHINILYVS